MLKYTLAATHKIINEIKLSAHIFSLVSSSVMLGYLIYMCFSDMGMLPLNLVLAILTAVNFVFYIVSYNARTKKMKRIKKKVARTYAISKLFLNAVSLVTVIYSIGAEPSTVSNIRLVAVPLMIILWILQLLFQIASIYAEKRLNLFVDGIKMDFMPMINGAYKIKNFIRDAAGEERVEAPGISDSNRETLEEQAEKDAEIKASKDKKSILMNAVKNIVKSKFGHENTGEEKEEEPLTK